MYLTGTSKVNQEQHLEIGGVDTLDLVKQFGTPLYVLDEWEIRRRMKEFVNTFKELEVTAQVAYASKALCTKTLCYIAHEEGLSLDVVSGGELYTALTSGFPTDRIHFHGNNKTIDEIRLGVKNEIGAFVIDNFYEIELIEQVASELGKRVNALLRISPGIEAHTHEYIQTGQEDSKFGFNLNGYALDAVKRVEQSDHIQLLGLHFHIGSQIFDMNGFDKAIERIADFYQSIQEQIQIRFPVLNTGGGFGIRYTNEDQPLAIKEYVTLLVQMVEKHFSQRSLIMPEIWIEPGRSIIGEAGTTLYTVGSSKEIPEIRKYIAVDGGMMDNPRQALYQAKYDAVIANKMTDQEREKVSVAGKACESGDMLIWDIELTKPKAGDILAVFSTGAYNYSMASNYNRVPRPAMVLVKDGNAELIVRRETYEDIVQYDIVPERFISKKMIQSK